MTKLPEKNPLTGNKTPGTTTGEMKEALGKLRDFLNDLFGNDSGDKKSARETLGIDLDGISQTISLKADKTDLSGKASLEELDNVRNAVNNKADIGSISALQDTIMQSSVATGCVNWFAMNTAPAGYLAANGDEVSRETYAALFAVIGTIFGAGDGETTFNLPDIRGEFIRGWDESNTVDPGRTFGSKQESSKILSNTGTAAGNFSRVSWSGYRYTADAEGVLDHDSEANYQDGLTSSPGTSGSNQMQRNFYRTIRPRNIALLACIKT